MRMNLLAGDHARCSRFKDEDEDDNENDDDDDDICKQLL